jgi:short subunit dehydrogenase-like uncharacterized protein|tara:strand:- start:122 stop:1285 length:1164 start_codon:yes stop_codon:yes gene_type:complete
MNNPANYDFVVYGASGFTGKLVVEYALNQYSNEDISWAIAGRNLEKLQNLKEKLKLTNDVGIIQVDSEDQSSIDALVMQTKCVLTTVGPYQLYGDKVVRACISSGTDYVDLCGEVGFMHKIISECSAEAKQTGARIVFSCGFDSIPFDLGVLFVQEEVMSRLNKYAPSVRGRVRDMNGEFSGGTAASMKATMAALQSDPELLNVLVNPHALCEGFQGVQQDDDSKPVYDEELDTWVAPFFMAPINTKNIHRSNKLMNHIYGESFKYNEMWIQGPGEEGKAAAEFISTMNPLGDAPEPGEGPSRESRENGNYDVLFCADVDGETIKASVNGDMDPGYGSTSKMITESAICLVKDCQDLAGGIYTPASSMGTKLIKRLESNAGLTFKLE